MMRAPAKGSSVSASMSDPLTSGVGVGVGEGVGVGVSVGGIGVGVAVGGNVGVGVDVKVGVGVSVGASAVWVAKMMAATSVAWASSSAWEGPQVVKMTPVNKTNAMPIICFSNS